MKKVIMFLAVFLSAFSLVTSASAYTVIYDAGTTYDTSAISDYNTSMADMAGMTVVATFADGSSQSVVWTSAGASGTNFDLTADLVTTYNSNSWNLNLTTDGPLTNLYLDGGPGDTVFDVLSDAYYSPDSALGKAFSTSYSRSLTVTYADQVTVGGVWYGDLYKTMNLDFDPDGFIGSMSFSADTDNLKYPGDINPTVPEPTTFLLFGLGILGIAGISRKKTA